MANDNDRYAALKIDMAGWGENLLVFFDDAGGNLCPVDATELDARLDALVHTDGTDTRSVDVWQWPYCEHNQDWDDTGESGAVAVRDLSGHSQELICTKCGRAALVSISIEYTAQRVEG